MNLDINSATAGADSTGLEELYESIHADCILSAINVMHDNTARVTEAIRTCWSGTDEERFEENLNTFIGQVESALNILINDITNIVPLAPIVNINGTSSLTNFPGGGSITISSSS